MLVHANLLDDAQDTWAMGLSDTWVCLTRVCAVLCETDACVRQTHPYVLSCHVPIKSRQHVLVQTEHGNQRHVGWLRLVSSKYRSLLQKSPTEDLHSAKETYNVKEASNGRQGRAMQVHLSCLCKYLYLHCPQVLALQLVLPLQVHSVSKSWLLSNRNVLSTQMCSHQMCCDDLWYHHSQHTVSPLTTHGITTHNTRYHHSQHTVSPLTRHMPAQKAGVV